MAVVDKWIADVVGTRVVVVGMMIDVAAAASNTVAGGYVRNSLALPVPDFVTSLIDLESYHFPYEPLTLYIPHHCPSKFLRRCLHLGLVFLAQCRMMRLLRAMRFRYVLFVR